MLSSAFTVKMAPIGDRSDRFAPEAVGAWTAHFEEQGYAILVGLLDSGSLVAAQKGCNALASGT